MSISTDSTATASQVIHARPLFLADWRRVLFIHFAIDPRIFQPSIPFPLDLFDGRAYVSLVAFTQSRLRPAFGGRIAERLVAPLAEHEFLNLRTYVRPRPDADERAIYFIAEWIPNRLAALLGPRTYGLPYRLGRLAYDHHEDVAPMTGRVDAEGASLQYRASIARDVEFTVAPRSSLTEFLIERYVAYTCRHGVRRRFEIRHAPWRRAELQVDLLRTTLLSRVAPWFSHAQCVAAEYSPGARDVEIGAPRRLHVGAIDCSVAAA